MFSGMNILTQVIVPSIYEYIFQRLALYINICCVIANTPHNLYTLSIAVTRSEAKMGSDKVPNSLILEHVVRSSHSSRRHRQERTSGLAQFSDGWRMK